MSISSQSLCKNVSGDDSKFGWRRSLTKGRSGCADWRVQPDGDKWRPGPPRRNSKAVHHPIQPFVMRDPWWLRPGCPVPGDLRGGRCIHHAQIHQGRGLRINMTVRQAAQAPADTPAQSLRRAFAMRSVCRKRIPGQGQVVYWSMLQQSSKKSRGFTDRPVTVFSSPCTGPDASGRLCRNSARDISGHAGAL